MNYYTKRRRKNRWKKKNKNCQKIKKVVSEISFGVVRQEG